MKGLSYMTSFGTLTNTMTRQKVQIINRLLVLDIIAILLTILYAVYRGQLSENGPLIVTSSYSMIVYMVAFILIARSNEHIFVSDAYRLVPISDTGLYSANLLSAFISFIYLMVTQFIFSTVAAAMNFNQLLDAFKKGLRDSAPSSANTSEVLGGLIGLIFLMLAAAILMWASVSMVHLITSALMAFLPDSRSRLYRFILYVVVIAASVYILSKIINPIGDLFTGMGNGDSFYQIYLAGFSLLIVAALESVVNVYLLRNWVETIN
ncbi:ABC transporter permease [Lentilactobacillus raoultii]|uniref:ABC transporter permease n=1 Tax=Lentilactobacillus raoultii TaxID=1987503 RepID=A0ABW3PNZ4_9LACO|nr:ABC transporter permease [Lentilactobacillus raoultii]